MSSERRISLERIRADGWFERLGESIGSFHTLCEVLGDRFFALALVLGVRVSSLMIDRFSPDHSLVEFTFSGLDDDADPGPSAPVERVTVAEFRRRLFETLKGPQEVREPWSDGLGTDPEAVQRYLGPRILLLAPLYDYRLEELIARPGSVALRVVHADRSEICEIDELSRRLQGHVEEDLRTGVPRRPGTAIDLNRVTEAEEAAAAGRWATVVELLGSWPLPLAIYWRTPEGQLLAEKHRQRIADGLGLLGTACVRLGDVSQGEEVLRLAVQYAQDGSSAPAIFRRIGRRLVESERFGEAIAPLRRAHTLGGPREDILLDLATVLLERRRLVGALGCLREAEATGVPAAKLRKVRARVSKDLADALDRWQKLVGKP